MLDDGSVVSSVVFVFEKKKLNSPLQVINAISHRLLSWAILQKPEL